MKWLVKAVTQMCYFLELAQCGEHSCAQLAVAEQQQEQPEVLLSQTLSASPRLSLAQLGTSHSKGCPSPFWCLNVCPCRWELTTLWTIQQWS